MYNSSTYESILAGSIPIPEGTVPTAGSHYYEEARIKIELKYGKDNNNNDDDID